MSTILGFLILVLLFLKSCKADDYSIFKQYPSDYNEAESECYQDGRYLTSIDSLSQNQQIIGLCQVLITCILRNASFISIMYIHSVTSVAGLDCILNKIHSLIQRIFKKYL